MEYISDVGVWGGIASLIGAAIAIWQAWKSNRSANQAEAARIELVQRRDVGDVEAVAVETSRILKVVAKVGPSCTIESIRGMSAAGIATEVDEYRMAIGERSSTFEAEGENEIERLCRELEPEIVRLSEAGTFEEIKDAGRSIHGKVMGFHTVIRQLARQKWQTLRHTVKDSADA